MSHVLNSYLLTYLLKRITIEKSCVCSYNADPVLSGGLSAFSSEPDETGKDGYKEHLREVKSGEITVSVTQQVASDERLVLLVE